MMAAILSCSPVVFTSCTSEDNPVVDPTTDEKNADRVVFEKILSERLARAANDIRFQSALVSTKALSDFLTN